MIESANLFQHYPSGAMDNAGQHYPPDSFGIQNIFKEFPTNNFVTDNGKERYCPKGGRVRNRFAVSTWEPRSGS